MSLRSRPSPPRLARLCSLLRRFADALRSRGFLASIFLLLSVCCCVVVQTPEQMEEMKKQVAEMSPEAIEEAMNVVKNSNPEEIKEQMKGAPLPEDPAEMRRQMEA